MYQFLRYCSELYAKYKGMDVWIAGSDPSLGEYPDDFLDAKVSITLHLAHLKFPRATWRYSSEYDRSAYLASVDPEYARRPLIAALPLYGRTVGETKRLLAPFIEVFYHRMRSYPPTGVRGEVDSDFTLWKVRQTLHGKAHIWGAHGTCLHNAIYMALVMGAGTIHLIGCGHGMYRPQQEHFDVANTAHFETRPWGRSFSDSVEHVPLIEQTLALQAACREEGIELVWHRCWTPAMNDQLVPDSQWLAREKELATRKFSLTRRCYWTLYKRPLNRIISRF